MDNCMYENFSCGPVSMFVGFRSVLFSMILIYHHFIIWILSRSCQLILHDDKYLFFSCASFFLKKWFMAVKEEIVRCLTLIFL